ncbi:MAG: putative hydroxymethylpyrimidine transporter CytX [Methanobacteriota archaeon]|nr:MAG: putative hydroxymethylpyrimidine transporter CytX [Euryarchaeota archaeon]
MVRRPLIRRPPEWGVDPVPAEARQLRAFDVFVFWSSLGVGLLVLAAGALLVLAFGLTLWESLVVSLAGSLVGSLMLAGAAHHGSKAGVPTMVSLRPILGRRGSYAASALNVLQLLGWAAFELLIMGIAASVLLLGRLDFLTASAFVLVFGGVVATLALGGPLAVIRAWLEKFAIWLVYASTIVIAVALALRGVAWNARPTAPSFSPPGSLLLGLDLVIVMPVSWWPLIADYNRFARTAKASAAGTTLGYVVANTAFYVLGAALAVYALAYAPASGDFLFLAAIGLLGLGAFPLLFILVDETDNAFANVYSTAVSVQNLAPKRRQFGLILAATVVAIAGAWFLLAVGQGIGGGYESFLFVIGGVFVPLLGVVIADSFLVRRGAYRLEEFFDDAPRVRWTAIVSWIAGGAVYFGIIENWIPGFPSIGATLPSFLVAAGLHVALARAESAASSAGHAAPGREHG